MKNILRFPLLSSLMVIIISSFPYLANSQTTVDASRMERDIDIMEKVLNELFSNRSSTHNPFNNVKFSSERTAQGSYLPGYGVLFITPAYAGWANASKSFISTERGWKGTVNIAPVASPQAGMITKGVDENKPMKSEEKPKEKAAQEGKAPQAKMNVYHLNADSMLKAQIELVTKNMKEFLVNYADAIGQLPADNRILLIYNENARTKSRNFTIDHGDRTSLVAMPRISAEVKREDLATYRSGKMDRKGLESRIKIKQENEEKENYAEYKVFAGIVESLYPVNQQSLYRVRNISYHYLPSFGVVYLIDMNLRDELFASTALRYKTAITLTEVEQSKTDSSQVKLREEAYGQFENDIRATLLDYGRTLRNLSAEQIILLTVSLPTCEACKVPERVNVSIKKSVIDAYEQNKIDRKAALESIYIGAVPVQK